MKEALRHFCVEKEQRIQLSCIKKRTPVVYMFVYETGLHHFTLRHHMAETKVINTFKLIQINTKSPFI